MSYRDHHQSLRERAASGAAVIVIQAGIGLALVTGLTMADVIQVPEKRLKGTIVPLDPPPPPPPEDTPLVAKPTQTPMAPPRPFPLPPAPGPSTQPFEDIAQPLDRFPAPTPMPTLAPSPPIPRPSPSFAPKRPVPLAHPGSWISTDDYPSAPLRRGVEGLAGYRLVIGSDGRVTACELTRPSGNAQLDAATCRLLERRARFAPATDGTGATTVGTYTGTVQWEIPD